MCVIIVFFQLQVRAIKLTATPFTIENGMLTPTLKAAREVIRREYAPAMQILYEKTNAANPERPCV